MSVPSHVSVIRMSSIHINTRGPQLQTTSQACPRTTAMASPQTPLSEYSNKPVEQSPPCSPDTSSVTEEASPAGHATSIYYRLDSAEQESGFESNHKGARSLGSGDDYDQEMLSDSEEDEEAESCASTPLQNVNVHESEYVEEASNSANMDTQELLQSLDITGITRSPIYQYTMKLETSRTHLAMNPRNEVRLQLTRHPLTFHWQQFDDSPPRPGRFRLASPRDLVQLARAAHECFQFSLELNAQGPPREPYYPISEQEWRKKLITELRYNLVFVLEWTAIGDDEDPKDFGSESSDVDLDLEASEKYSELFAMCVVSLDGFDPENDLGEELRALVVPSDEGQTMFTHIEAPIQVISLRGEFTYDEQLGLGDNPVGIRTGVTNIPSAGGRHLGSGSGIYLRKTMIGDLAQSLAGKKEGLKYR